MSLASDHEGVPWDQNGFGAVEEVLWEEYGHSTAGAVVGAWDRW